jgi:hypothetical protein
MKKTTLSVVAAALMAAGALGYVQGCKEEEPITVTGYIEGTITDWETTQAVPGVMVDIVSNSSTTFAKQSRQTGDDGKFAFKDLEAGNYKLSFARSGYKENSKDVNVVAGQVVSCDVTLAPKSTTVTHPDFKVENGILTNYAGEGGDVVIPADLGITNIGEAAFRDQLFLTSVVIPEGVVTLEKKSFYNCMNLKSVVLSGSVKVLGNESFYGCDSLSSVTLYKNLTYIGDYCFFGCKNLDTITLPDSLTVISFQAFGGSGLTSVKIPKNVTKIYGNAFTTCTKLTDVYVSWDPPLDIPSNTFSDGLPRTARTLHVPAGTKDAYIECTDVLLGIRNYRNQFWNIVED